MNPLKRERADEIVKLSDIDHVLQASDMYINQRLHAVSPPTSRFVFNNDTKRMEYLEDISYPYGLLKIFDEVLVNACDNSSRADNPTTKIQVRIDPEEGRITVRNNGNVFKVSRTDHPSRFNPAEKAYQPELAFFECKSSSNYQKKQKTVGGKNGLGGKVASILSTKSRIMMCDGETFYQQDSFDHMRRVSKPIVKPATKAQKDKPFLEFSFVPDVPLFYPETKDASALKLTPLLLRLFLSRVYDIAGTTKASVQVSYAEGGDSKFEVIPVRTFKDYAKLYLPPGVDDVKMGYYETERWQVVLIRNPFSYAHAVSFVNNINTYQGGTHVKYILKQVLTFCKDSVDGIDARRVANFVMPFVNAVIEDPSFSSQSKEELLTAPSEFGSTCVLDARCLNVVKREGILDAMKQAMESKEVKKLNAEMGVSKRAKVNDIVNMRDAEFAGSKKSQQCSLFLVEGKSALQLAEVAISHLGHEFYGALAVKGKGINGDAAVSRIAANEEFVNLCRMMGLWLPDPKIGKLPPKRSDLRYGRIIFFTDQDADGAHIEGLLLYLFQKIWPHLLVEPGFLCTFITPIVVATKADLRVPFYSLQEFQQWEQAQGKKAHSFKIKYYKGLGTSTAKDAKIYFKTDFKKLLKPYAPRTPEDATALTHAFTKKEKDGWRKTWVKSYNPKTSFLPYDKLSQIRITDFVNTMLKHFAWVSLQRGIPLVQDGLTTAQRKCLHVFLKRNIVDDVKVAEMQGEISKATSYHHNADSLSATMIHMAQVFVGRSNINLLVPSGQFGFRKDGGKSPSSSRYIFTRLTPITRMIFRAEDDVILPKQFDEGVEIEPQFYSPIVPMVLINGCEGIGTGFVSSVPCSKPEDWIQMIRQRMSSSKLEVDATIPTPWYRGFKGSITYDGSGSFVSTGVIRQVGDIYEITELPIRKWRDEYKISVLLKMEQAGQIDYFQEKHTETEVFFRVKLSAGTVVTDPVEFFKLSLKFHGHLNALSANETDPAPVICSFPTRMDMFEVFYQTRLAMYEKRRIHLLQQLEHERQLKQAKCQFIQWVLDGKLQLGKPRSVMKAAMTALGLPEDFHQALLDVNIGSFCTERIQSLQAEAHQASLSAEQLGRTTATQLWERELKELETALTEFWRGSEG